MSVSSSASSAAIETRSSASRVTGPRGHVDVDVNGAFTSLEIMGENNFRDVREVVVNDPS